MAPALELKGVVVQAAAGFQVGPVDLTLAKGECASVVGRAGAGKSLLLSGLVGLVPLTAGEVTVDGVRLAADTLDDVRRRIGFCFQRDALLDDESALENVRVAVRARGLDNVDRRAREALNAVGLAGAFESFPAELSGGMRKRLGIARALACEPTLLLGDAVTAGLDPSTAAEVLSRLFARVRSRDMAAVVVTHDVDAVLPLSDRVLVLEEGRVAYSGATSGLAHVAALEAFAPRGRAA